MNKYAMLVNPEKIGKRYEIKLIPMRLPEVRFIRRWPRTSFSRRRTLTLSS